MMIRVLVCSLIAAAACGSDVAITAANDASAHDASAHNRPPGVMLCYTDAAEAHPATVAFRAALIAGDRSHRAAAIDGLEAAVKDLPMEEELQLLLGLAHLWRLAEPLPGEDTLIAQLFDAIAARDHLKVAYQLCPTDHRIAAWLGPILVRFGRNLNDQSAIDEGLMVLDQGIAAYPAFVLFSKLLIYADAARDAPEFQQALAAVLANLDDCDRAPSDPACTNLSVIHNREGGSLFLGDALTKAGRRADAEVAYTGGAMGADFATWPFRATITERVHDLDARIALYGDTVPSNDPPAAWNASNQCALCHTR